MLSRSAAFQSPAGPGAAKDPIFAAPAEKGGTGKPGARPDPAYHASCPECQKVVDFRSRSESSYGGRRYKKPRYKPGARPLSVAGRGETMREGPDLSSACPPTTGR